MIEILPYRLRRDFEKAKARHQCTVDYFASIATDSTMKRYFEILAVLNKKMMLIEHHYNNLIKKINNEEYICE
jgi:hypothetical protein